jgi:hypothetical protein
MTAAEWDACDDPTLMLRFLDDKASGRKVRLAACACVRRMWRLLADARLRCAVEVTERFADGEATPEELDAARWDAARADYDVGIGVGTPMPFAEEMAAEWAARAALAVVRSDAELAEASWQSYAATAVAAEAGGAFAVDEAGGGAFAVADRGERKAQVALLRDVFGNPFRPIALDASWLAWNDGAIGKLARSIYDERAFSGLPLLADALEDAGCTDADILTHCREQGEHVRGCWAVDLLIGKS